jgi:shikimate kinase
VDDYYSHHPRRVLDRPLALVGFMGAGVSRTAHALASQQGLPFQELDRVVEHTAGMSRTRIVVEQGEPTLRAIEREQLVRLLADRPFGVLALGDGALLDDASRQRVREQAQLVHVQRPLEVVLDAIRRELQASPGCYPEFVFAAPDSVEDLKPLHDERLPGYREADVAVLAHREHPRAVADRVAEMLGWL